MFGADADPMRAIEYHARFGSEFAQKTRERFLHIHHHSSAGNHYAAYQSWKGEQLADWVRQIFDGIVDNGPDNPPPPDQPFDGPPPPGNPPQGPNPPGPHGQPPQDPYGHGGDPPVPPIVFPDSPLPCVTVFPGGYQFGSVNDVISGVNGPLGSNRPTPGSGFRVSPYLDLQAFQDQRLSHVVQGGHTVILPPGFGFFGVPPAGLQLHQSSVLLGRNSVVAADANRAGITELEDLSPPDHTTKRKRKVSRNCCLRPSVLSPQTPPP